MFFILFCFLTLLLWSYFGVLLLWSFLVKSCCIFCHLKSEVNTSVISKYVLKTLAPYMLYNITGIILFLKLLSSNPVIEKQLVPCWQRHQMNNSTDKSVLCCTFSKNRTILLPVTTVPSKLSTRQSMCQANHAFQGS